VTPLIALIAHDGKKDELAEVVRRHLPRLDGAPLVATETTGHLLSERFGLDVRCMLSGPFGGDLQIGALVAAGHVGLVVFLRDPLTAHAHDPDINALMKVCDVHRVPLATNAGSAHLCLAAYRGAPVSIPAWREHEEDD
jgi:methylglyoxal synthase